MSAAQPPLHITAEYFSGLSGQLQTDTKLKGSCTSPTLPRRHRRSSNPLALVRSQRSPIGQQVIAPASDASQKQQWNDYPQLDALTTQEWQRNGGLEQIHELPQDGVTHTLSQLSPQTPSSQGAPPRHYDLAELSPQTLNLQSAQSRQSSGSSWDSWGSTNLGLTSATTQSSGYSGFTNLPYLCESPHELPCESDHKSTNIVADRDLGFDCPFHAAPGGEAKCRYHPRSPREGLHNMNRVRDHVCSHGLVCNDCSSIFRRWTHFRTHRKHRNRTGTCPNDGEPQIQVSNNSSNKPIDLPPDVILRFFEDKKALQSEAEQWMEGYKILFPQWQITRIPSPYYTENVKAKANERNGHYKGEQEIFDSSNSPEQQKCQPTVMQPVAEDSLAPVASWLKRTQVQAGPTSCSGALNAHSENTQGSSPLSTRQSLQSTPAHHSDDWMWNMPDDNLSDGLMFQSPLEDNAPENGQSFQTFETHTVHHESGIACEPACLPASYIHYQQPKEKSPGAFAQLKKLCIPRRSRKPTNAPSLPALQPSHRAPYTAQQPTSAMSKQPSLQANGISHTEPVPSLKRSRRTDSTSSRSPVSKKACGSLERANSLSKLRNLHSKLHAAKGERDQLVEFVREFRQEVDKWDSEDESAGEVQDLIDVFNMGLKKIRHLL